MVEPIPVTAPGTEPSTSRRRGTQGEGESAAAVLSPVPSEKGATGTSSGTWTRATSEARSRPRRLALSSLPPGPTSERCSSPTRRVGRGDDETTLGHGDADQRHDAVGGRGLQLDHGATGGLGDGGHRVLQPGQGGHRGGRDGVGRARGRAGGRRRARAARTTKATTPATAAAPTRAMSAVRWRLPAGGCRSTGPVRRRRPVGTSLGWRQSRSSGSIQPRSGAVGVIAAAALFRARSAFRRLLGRVAHLGEATEIGPEMPSRLGRAVP